MQTSRIARGVGRRSVFFFFQAEDGIRDLTVTGVQTCALPISRRSLSLERWRLFGYEKYQETGRAVDREDRETRALDEHIKNLPKGQMEILMTDDTRGTLHTLLHVRPPAEVKLPSFEPELYPRLRHSRADSIGANLRFKNP